MPRLDARIDSPWDALFALSLFGIAAAFGYALLAPQPKAIDPSIARHGLSRAQESALRTKAQADEAEGKARERIWSLPPDELGRRVMDDVGRIAERRRLQLANFSSGRTVSGGGLRQYAFSVTLEGAFFDVLAAMDDLESPHEKLALSMASVAPDEGGVGAVGRVSATLSLTAFTKGEED